MTEQEQHIMQALYSALKLYCDASALIPGDLEENNPIFKKARTLGFLAIKATENYVWDERENNKR